MCHRQCFSHRLMLLSLGLALALPSLFANAQGPGRGPMGGPGRGRGQQDPQFQADRQDYQYLLAHRDDIERTVTMLSNGVETVTESDDPAVAEHIKTHVAAMHRRIVEGDPIRLRDPLFNALFQHAESITLEIEETEKGVHVIETSDDENVVPLIQAHAQVVSLFIENGPAEVRRNHEVPETGN